MTSSPRIALAPALALLIVAAGCAVGPNYTRPDLDLPESHRGSEATSVPTSTGPDSPRLADLDWRTLYPDPQLHAYLAEALTNNWDLRIAIARVLQAEAAARVARAEFFPTVSAGADWSTARASQRGPTAPPAGVDPHIESFGAQAAMAAYEVDLWGRIRRANEAARARLQASDDARNTIRATLVAQVASTYFQLVELDFELEVSRRTHDARSNSLLLTQAREEGGVASLQDVHQAQILVATAEASIADTHRRIAQTENQLCLLLGRNPASPDRGLPLLDQRLTLSVPPSLPADLLERRPDLRAAEQQLIAANADIGQARAAFFPRITLTGLYGFQSLALSDLFTSPARTWQFGPSVSVPLFTGGALRGNLQGAKARFDEALASYQAAVQNAFREVSDSLIAYQRSREFRARLEERTQAHRSATELANVRYQGGVTSYLEVLYNEQELFSAELGLAQARLAELLAVVQLYRALGGGWQSGPGA